MADHGGRPVAFALTPGNVADITMATPLLDALPASKRLVADKAAAGRAPQAQSDRAFILPPEELAARRHSAHDRLARNFLSGLALIAAATEWAQ